MKLLPFDLDKAKAGYEVVTRNGNPARILCDNLNSPYCIAAVIIDRTGIERVECFTLDGKTNLNFQISPVDLFLKPKTQSLWVNIYYNAVRDEYYLESAELYSTKEKAAQDILPDVANLRLHVGVFPLTFDSRNSHEKLSSHRLGPSQSKG